MFAVMAAGIAGSSAAVSSQPRTFGRTIAGITVGRDRLDRVRALYGPGAQTTVTDVQSLCYYVKRDHSYLSVSTFERESRIRSVSLTTFANVAPGCQDATIEGRHLTASAGVALGDPMARVLSALGRPAETGKLRIGADDVVQADYRVAGGKATCMFEHDRLVLIAVELD